MEYRVLARKYRPQSFVDLIGQDVLVRTLTNAFATGRVAHAFLLTGIRGIGKTTTARIIARALNCIGEDGKGSATIQPCGVCANCVMIAESRHMDVLEIDAASNTSVEGVRDIINSVQYLPNAARFKVYIIDEVHMLSNSAFNALLKTLEEPPAHVKFIFATTEIRKIPVTILSRCQKFELRRVEAEVLVNHLKNILVKESIHAEDKALAIIADAAEGSVRDSLSLLDQAIAHNAENTGVISAAAVRDMLGMHDKSQIFALLENVFSGAIENSLAHFRKLYVAGADPIFLLQDMLSLVHFITRTHITHTAVNDNAFSEEEQQFVQRLSQKLTIPSLTKFWQILLKGLQETRLAPDPLSSAEMTIIRLAYSADLPSPSELIRSIRKHDNAELRHPSSPAAMPSRAPVSLITTNQVVPQHMPDVSAAQPAVSITSFVDAVELFRIHREPILYTYLTRDVRLVGFEEGRIEINESADVPKDFVSRVSLKLGEWTQKRWVVVLSKESGREPLQVERDAAEKKAREDIKTHPLVASVLEQFPQASITQIMKEQTP